MKLFSRMLKKQTCSQQKAAQCTLYDKWAASKICFGHLEPSNACARESQPRRIRNRISHGLVNVFDTRTSGALYRSPLYVRVGGLTPIAPNIYKYPNTLEAIASREISLKHCQEDDHNRVLCSAARFVSWMRYVLPYHPLRHMCLVLSDLQLLVLRSAQIRYFDHM